MILKHSLVVRRTALALSGCSSAQTAAGGPGPSLPQLELRYGSGRPVEQGMSTPNLDDDVTQGIQSGGVDRAIGGR
jgi:hypothetical protein